MPPCLWGESKLAKIACSGSLAPPFVNNDYVTAEITYSIVHPHQEVLAWSWATLCYAHVSVQFSSVAQSCPTLCNPMNRSTPILSVHHQLPEFTQTHVHWVGNAIQPAHPLSSPSTLQVSKYHHIKVRSIFPVWTHTQFNLSVQSLSHVWLFETPWTAAH